MNILFEIGTEEIPARFLPYAMEGMKDIAGKLLAQYAIVFERIITYSTPRRLVILIYDISTHQSPRTITRFGPPKNAAYDKDGRHTKAAISFAASCGIDIDEIVILKKEKKEGSGQFGEYIAAVIEEKGKPSKNIIPEIFNRLLSSLLFPKMMRWGDYDVRFARPIRWILALCDGLPFNVEFGGVKSSNFTFGHRFLVNHKIEITSIEQYKTALRDAYVIVDPDERRALIERQMTEIEGELKASVIKDEELLQTVGCIVEYSAAVTAEFSEVFLRLPKELLISVMRGHQKYFALFDQRGSLINKCIVISNTLKENADNVRKGAEKVLNARFDDARFYFEEDTKTPLIEKVEMLKTITFQQRLGSVYDKVKRLKAISLFLSKVLYNEDISQLDRAVTLCKADLVTGVVKEFPELQGIIGSHYAHLDGEGEIISQAILEQYLPRHSEDMLPKSKIGIILSMADKLDNIASCFALGLIPTGSKDPYALRRQGFGIIMILKENRFKVSLSEFFSKPIVLIKEVFPDLDVMPFMDKVKYFFQQRLESIFLSEGYTHDQIDAAMYDFMNIPLYFINNRLNAFKELREGDDYNEFLLAIKRVHNIIPKGFSGEIDKEILAEEDEKKLYEKTVEVESRFKGLTGSGDFKGAVRCLKELISYINKFFDTILVMDKNEEIRHNRLGLLKYIHDISIEAGNISLLIEK